MAARGALKNLLNREGLSRGEKVLLLLGSVGDAGAMPATLRTAAIHAGVRGSARWNFSAILGSLKGLAVRTGTGWELTDKGQVEVARLQGAAPIHVAAANSSLRAASAKISSTTVQEFVQEAIESAEAGHHRAAVVLSWVGALAVLYDLVLRAHLSQFNAEASRREAAWRAASSVDDLARMKEYDFLQVLGAISVLGKSVKTELEGCLKLRNGCGHPNSLRISENRVAAHIEILVLNVFAPFS